MSSKRQAMSALIVGMLAAGVTATPAAAEHPCDAPEPPPSCYEEPGEDPVPTPGVPPAPPTGVQVTRAQDQALTVEWSDGSPDEDLFRVELRRPDGTWGAVAHPSALAGGSGRIVVPVPTAGQHCVRVRAVNVHGASAPGEGCADTTPPKHRVSVLTLNLVGDDDLWDPGTGVDTEYVPWRDRYDRVARWMQSTGTVPDVMTFQEVYGVKLGLWDYETLFVLIDRIRARTGVSYRIAQLGTRRATNTIRAGTAVLYNPARLSNTTPPVGDLAYADDHPFEPLNGLHGRASYRCTNPPAALAALCSSIDGSGGYWTGSYHHPSGSWGPGPTFSSFELRAEPGSHVHVYNLHAPLDAQSHFYAHTRQLIAAAELRWSSRTRLYPPIVTGDFNATLGDPGNAEFASGGPFADFEVAAFSVPPDEIGILKGRPAVFPARTGGTASAHVLPVPGPKAPNCGSPAVLWSDHCGVLVELLPSGPLSDPVRRTPQPTWPTGPVETDPLSCLRKPYLPECGGP